MKTFGGPDETCEEKIQSHLQSLRKVLAEFLDWSTSEEKRHHNYLGLDWFWTEYRKEWQWGREKENHRVNLSEMRLHLPSGLPKELKKSLPPKQCSVGGPGEVQRSAFTRHQWLPPQPAAGQCGGSRAGAGPATGAGSVPQAPTSLHCLCHHDGVLVCTTCTEHRSHPTVLLQEAARCHRETLERWDIPAYLGDL
ncbi:uncharacterized protein LOC121363644 isoform X3 [Pyrgilauda ruficollis]|uniref:uncharacterized protein LOC121363644 isoform X3 n=1 Tax=Pyrgilauda ruficollis TaxID=221976 RepID=UPI001B8809C9|nr:uncharacterized protein LOC121363644 isoform X3 [Pyrgilauda ruficollis]